MSTSKNLFRVEEDVHKLLTRGRSQARGGGGNPCYSYDEAASQAASRHRHGNVLKKLQYVPELRQFIALEQRSVAITLYDGDDLSMAKVMRPRSNRGVPDAVAYVPERDVMISCSGDLRMKWWDMGDACAEDESKSWNLENSQVCLQWVPEHQRLYSGSMLGMIHTWDIEHGTECAKAMHGHGPQHTSPLSVGNVPPTGKGEVVTELAYLPGIDKLVSAGLDSRVCIWNIDVNERTHLLGKNFEKHAKPKGHVRGVLSLAYFEDYKLLVSAGFDHEALVWSPFGNSVLFKLEGHRTSLTSVERLGGASSPHLLSCDEDGVFKVWDIRRAADCLETFSAGDEGVRGVACTACVDQADPAAVEEGVRGRSRASPSSKVSSPASKSSSGGEPEAAPLLPRILVSTNSGAIGQIHVFSPEATLATLQANGAAHVDSVLGCAYEPAHDRLLTASGSSIKVWSASSGALVKTFRDIVEGTITALATRISNRIFFVGDDRGGVSMFNFYSGALLKRLLRHRLEISALIVNANTLFSMSWDGSIVVHDIANAQTEAIRSRPFIADPTHAHEDDLTCSSILLTAQPGKSESNSSPTRCFWPLVDDGVSSGSSSPKGQNSRVTRPIASELLATGSADGSVRLWELETGKLAAHLKHPAGSIVSCIRFLSPLPLVISADNLGAEIWGLPRTSSGKYPSVVRFKLTDFGFPVLDEDDSDDEDGVGAAPEKFDANAPRWAVQLALPVIVAMEWDGESQRLYVGDDYGQIFCLSLVKLEQHGFGHPVLPELLWRRRPRASCIRLMRVCRAKTHIRDAVLITTYVDGRIGMARLRDGAPLGWLQEDTAELVWNFPLTKEDLTLAPFPGSPGSMRRSRSRSPMSTGRRSPSSKFGDVNALDSDEEEYADLLVDADADDDVAPERLIEPEATAMQWWRAKAREAQQAASSSSAGASELVEAQKLAKQRKMKIAKLQRAKKASDGTQKEAKFGQATVRPANWISTKGLLSMPHGREHTMTQNRACKSAAEKLLQSFDDWNDTMAREAKNTSDVRSNRK